ncbi:MAG: hypothetical protein ACRCYO_00545, partial [Bacteroidia bacterium]
FLGIALVFLCAVGGFIFYRLRQQAKTQVLHTEEEADLPMFEAPAPLVVEAGKWKQELQVAAEKLHKGDGVQMARFAAHALLYWMCEQTGLAEAEASVENIRYRFKDQERLAAWLDLRERCALGQYAGLPREGQELLLSDVRHFFGA